MKKQPVAVFRVTINEHELVAIIDDLSLAKARGKINMDSDMFLTKLQVLAIKNQRGHASPSYVQTGRVGNVGADLLALLSDDAKTKPVVGSPNVIIDRRNDASQIDISNYTETQIEDAKFAEQDSFIQSGVHKDWREFLPKPVIINDRRKSDEIDSKDDDSDLAAALLG